MSHRLETIQIIEPHAVQSHLDPALGLGTTTYPSPPIFRPCDGEHATHHLPLPVMETNTEVVTVEGVEVRRIKPGVYVREDEWQGYLEFNEVRPVVHLSSCFPADLTVALESVLHAQTRTIRRASSGLFPLSRTRPLSPYVDLRVPNLTRL